MERYIRGDSIERMERDIATKLFQTQKTKYIVPLDGPCEFLS